MSFDKKAARPFFIQVVDCRADGGISEEKAQEKKAIATDSFVLLRALLDENDVFISTTAIEGWTGEPMSFQTMQAFWLSFTSHLAKQKIRTPEEEKMRAFCERVLNMLRLDTELDTLKAPTPPSTST